MLVHSWIWVEAVYEDLIIVGGQMVQVHLVLLLAILMVRTLGMIIIGV